ncbi:unnamed protein product, partial [Laminaria digitata]
MDGVLGRCMSTSKGRQLLGKQFGAVVEQLVGVHLELHAAQTLFAARRPCPRSRLERSSTHEESFTSDEDEFDLSLSSGAARRRAAERRSRRSGSFDRVVPRAAREGEEEGDCGRVARLVLGLLKTLVVDSPTTMTSYVCGLHPFPDGVMASSSTGLQAVSRAVASRLKVEADADAALASAVAPSAAARAATKEAAARDAHEAASAVEVWQAAERLVEGSVGEG